MDSSEGQKRRALFCWCLYDWANSAFATVILATVLPVYFVALVPATGARLLPWSSHAFSATSLWGYSVALSMLLIAVAAPLLGILADRRGYHKRLLTLFWGLGCTATVLLYSAESGRYLLAAALFVAANIGFAGANVFYNAYLPLLAHGEEADRLSSRGYAYGYIGGGLVLALVFVLINSSADPAAMTRSCFVLTGLWWFAFTLPLLRYLPATTARAKTAPPRKHDNLIKQLRQHRDLLIFLLAFLCYNDGIQTLISVSAVYAREQLQLSQASIMGCFLMIQFLAMPGALLCNRVSNAIGPKRTILICLLLFMVICLGASRMTTATQFWCAGAAIAMILGGSQALSRSLYASLIPADKTAEFFGFFTISSKFAAIVGPLLFALISDISSDSRQAILALALFFIIGSLLLAGVNVARGQQQAKQSG